MYIHLRSLYVHAIPIKTSDNSRSQHRLLSSHDVSNATIGGLSPNTHATINYYIHRLCKFTRCLD